MYIQLQNLRLYPLAIVLTAVFGSLFSPVYANQEPYKQDFVITAYYSPLPNQCCYFRGSYDEEITFNGKGTNGADGTEVYAGMLAGPPSYAFGTVVALDGVGVGTIHDRGGRIIEWGGDLHRIDIWMGSGEEGLARAMAWGVRRVSGTVYPLGTKPPAESIALSAFPSDPSAIAGLGKTDTITLLASASFDDASHGVRVLQQKLKDLGYFDHAVTGSFGEVTKQSLRSFQAAMGIQGDGASVGERTAAAMQAATLMQTAEVPALGIGLERGSEGQSVRLAQKVMRYIGAYKGRTDGIYDRDFRAAVVAFQRKAGVIKDEAASGAGRIGPATHKAIIAAWKLKQAKKLAVAVLRKHQLASRVRSEDVPGRILAKGDRGQEVKKLQELLGQLGYFDPKLTNANFGDKTQAALLKYQLDREIVESDASKGAGVFGPATKQAMLKDAVEVAWREVRASGL